jgi:hypothetical protein
MEREYIIWASEYSDSGFFCYTEGQEIVPKQEEEEPEEITDIIEALKASLQVKSKPPRQRKSK